MPFLNSYQRARLLLLTGSILCFIAFWFSANVFHIPRYTGQNASLLIGSPSILTFIIIAIVLAISVAIGTAVAGMVRFNAGLLTASLGLAALSFRGGQTRRTILWGLTEVGQNQ